MFSKITQKRSEMIWRLTAHRMKNKFLNFSNKMTKKLIKKKEKLRTVKKS